LGLVITVAGPHGSGKSTYGKKIADTLNFRHISIGNIFREIAKQKNLSLEEFSIYVEKHPEIDNELDNRIVEEAKKGDNVVIDSQLSAWMTKDLSQIKFYFNAPISVRVKRIAERDGVSFEKAKRETIAREKSEKKRYRKLYNIDITDLSIYDIMINTANWSLDSAFEIIKKAIIEFQKNIN